MISLCKIQPQLKRRNRRFRNHTDLDVRHKRNFKTNLISSRYVYVYPYNFYKSECKFVCQSFFYASSEKQDLFQRLF